MSSILIKAMAELDEDTVLSEIKDLLSKNVSALDVIADLQEGMGIVGKKFEAEEYYLSELMMSAEIFDQATALLGVNVDSGPSQYGSFVLGTIFDDIHDIGKNIVGTIMRSNGFNVIDLGVDVSIEKFIDAIKENKPKVIGISCLLTTCFDNIKRCIKEIEDAGLRGDLKIIIGGGPVDDSAGQYVNADIVCKNAQQTVDYCKKIMGVN
jgi:dimethylamine corrinoid protein